MTSKNESDNKGTKSNKNGFFIFSIGAKSPHQFLRNQENWSSGTNLTIYNLGGYKRKIMKSMNIDHLGAKPPKIFKMLQNWLQRTNLTIKKGRYRFFRGNAPENFVKSYKN